jgi:hypothetical protein
MDEGCHGRATAVLSLSGSRDLSGEVEKPRAAPVLQGRPEWADKQLCSARLPAFCQCEGDSMPLRPLMSRKLVKVTQ